MSTAHSETTVSEQFSEQGFVVIPDLFTSADFDEIDSAFIQLVAEHTDDKFTSMRDPALASFLVSHHDVESRVYNAVRTTAEIRRIATDPRVAATLRGISPNQQSFGVLGKLILRIDVPQSSEEIANWHQDFHFVRGNTETITLWIPLQDVDAEIGCLLVQPGSHERGAVAHDHRIGKRDVPAPDVISSFHSKEVPMKLGDVLFFHSLLFHSGQLNRSDRIRYSFQFRYTPLGLPTDSEMGDVIPLRGEA